MKVEDGLATRDADVNADIETVWTVPRKNRVPCLLNCLGEAATFIRRGIKPVCDVTSGHEERMPLRDRKRVPNPENQFGFKE